MEEWTGSSVGGPDTSTKAGGDEIGEIIMAVFFVGGLVGLALGLALGAGETVIEKGGLDWTDLNRAVDMCEPYDPTFEQTLACTQAVYGGRVAQSGD